MTAAEPRRTWIDLDLLMREADRLEPLPIAATRLAALLAGEGWELEDIVRIVELDMALTTRLLRVVNAAAQRRGEPVTTVRDAVQRVGAGAVSAIAVAAGVKRQLRLAMPVYGTDEEGLWRHSVAAALTVEAMREVAGMNPRPESFTAALLHDVGKIVLFRYLGPEVLHFMRRAHDESGLSIADAESEILEVNHAELGALVGQHWGLPDLIVRGILLHHAPHLASNEDERRVCSEIFLAECVARTVVPGPGEEPVRPDEFEAIAQFGFGAERFEALCGTVSAGLEATLSAYA